MPYRSLRAPSLVLLTALVPAGCIVELDALEQYVSSSCRHGETHHHERSIDGPIHAVVVDGDVGEVVVRGHAEPGVRFEAELHADRGEARPVLDVREGVLHVSVDCSGRGCCGGDIGLSIPTAARLEVGLGVGDVEVSDLTGAVVLDVGTGDIELRDLAGELRSSTGTGRIEGEGLRAPKVKADMGTGDVELAWAGDAAPPSITVDVGTGNVALDVPTGAYVLKLDHGWGDIEVQGLDDRSDAEPRLEVDVGTGDIDIQGR